MTKRNIVRRCLDWLSSHWYFLLALMVALTLLGLLHLFSVGPYLRRGVEQNTLLMEKNEASEKACSISLSVDHPYRLAHGEQGVKAKNRIILWIESTDSTHQLSGLTSPVPSTSTLGTAQRTANDFPPCPLPSNLVTSSVSLTLQNDLARLLDPSGVDLGYATRLVVSGTAPAVLYLEHASTHDPLLRAPHVGIVASLVMPSGLRSSERPVLANGQTAIRLEPMVARRVRNAFTWIGDNVLLVVFLGVLSWMATQTLAARSAALQWWEAERTALNQKERRALYTQFSHNMLSSLTFALLPPEISESLAKERKTDRDNREIRYAEAILEKLRNLKSEQAANVSLEDLCKQVAKEEKVRAHSYDLDSCLRRLDQPDGAVVAFGSLSGLAKEFWQRYYDSTLTELIYWTWFRKPELFKRDEMAAEFRKWAKSVLQSTQPDFLRKELISLRTVEEEPQLKIALSQIAQYDPNRDIRRKAMAALNVAWVPASPKFEEWIKVLNMSLDPFGVSLAERTDADELVWKDHPELKRLFAELDSTAANHLVYGERGCGFTTLIQAQDAYAQISPHVNRTGFLIITRSELHEICVGRPNLDRLVEAVMQKVDVLARSEHQPHSVNDWRSGLTDANFLSRALDLARIAGFARIAIVCDGLNIAYKNESRRKPFGTAQGVLGLIQRDWLTWPGVVWQFYVNPIASGVDPVRWFFEGVGQSEANSEVEHLSDEYGLSPIRISWKEEHLRAMLKHRLDYASGGMFPAMSQLFHDQEAALLVVDDRLIKCARCSPRRLVDAGGNLLQLGFRRWIQDPSKGINWLQLADMDELCGRRSPV